MVERKIDAHADNGHLTRLSACLYVPIAAVDVVAIERYVGKVVSRLSPHDDSRAILVESDEPANPDLRRPVWKLPEINVLHEKLQVWVHVDYGAYRAAYCRAFPELDFSGLVMDHVLNRRVARLKGLPYLRIVPISRASNSSHGGLSEKWAVEYHAKPKQRKINAESKASIQYADVADIAKMMDVGGRGRFMEGVNEIQELIKPL